MWSKSRGLRNAAGEEPEDIPLRTFQSAFYSSWKTFIFCCCCWREAALVEVWRFRLCSAVGLTLMRCTDLPSSMSWIHTVTPLLLWVSCQPSSLRHSALKLANARSSGMLTLRPDMSADWTADPALDVWGYGVGDARACEGVLGRAPRERRESRAYLLLLLLLLSSSNHRLRLVMVVACADVRAWGVATAAVPPTHGREARARTHTQAEGCGRSRQVPAAHWPQVSLSAAPPSADVGFFSSFRSAVSGSSSDSSSRSSPSRRQVAGRRCGEGGGGGGGLRKRRRRSHTEQAARRPRHAFPLVKPSGAARKAERHSGSEDCCHKHYKQMNKNHSFIHSLVVVLMYIWM